jgi:hypothetical protein
MLPFDPAYSVSEKAYGGHGPEINTGTPAADAARSSACRYRTAALRGTR